MRTNEEKQKLIEEFKASGLSMNKWCQANGIATSTMSTWLGPKRKNKIKQIKKAKFIEVPKANIKKIGIISAVISSVIGIVYAIKTKTKKYATLKRNKK